MKTTCAPQPDLPLFEVAPDDPNVEWLLRWLPEVSEGETGWRTAAEILQAAGKPVSDANKRWVRALAAASQGQIFSGPGSPGYKLTTQMTHKEYQHYRNATMTQCDEMKARVIRTDRVFYARQPVGSGGKRVSGKTGE